MINQDYKALLQQLLGIQDTNGLSSPKKEKEKILILSVHKQFNFLKYLKVHLLIFCFLMGYLKGTLFSLMGNMTKIFMD